MTVGRRTFMRQVAGAVIATIAGASEYRASARDRRSAGYIERVVYAMGTTVSISAYGESRAHAVHATTCAFEELQRMDRLLSVFDPRSDVSALNRSAGQTELQVDPATTDVLRESARFSRLTNGAFDITVEPLMEAWGFRTDGPTSFPSDRQLRDAREGLGWRHVVVNDAATAALSHPATRIDLGGIAVGFTVDRMTQVLRREGVTAALINHSGDIMAFGAPPDSDGWAVVVPDPIHPEGSLAEFMLRDRAISTSSNTLSTRLVGNHRVGHILDPRTGSNPHGAVCTSVLAPTSIEADALSTALMVDGQPDGSWRDGRREAMMVYSDDRGLRVERVI